MTQLFMVRPAGAGPVAIPAPPEDLRLRDAVADDAEALAGLLAAAFEERWDADRVRRDLLDAPDVVRTHVLADAEGRLVGTASERIMDEHPGAGYVHWVGVAPEARGRRLGERLTALCVAGFAERGLPAAVLETDDFRVPAVRAYLRLGFVPECRDPEDRAEAERTAWSRLLPELLGPRSSGAGR